jgi:hypothetical protein
MSPLFLKFLNGNTKEQIKKNPGLSSALDFVALERDSFLKKDIPGLSWSAFKLYDTEGNRLRYEALYFERRKRLTILALACWLWEKREDIAALEDTIWAVCDEYSWCLPAHMEGASMSPAAPEDNRTRLDLFASETGFTLAEICAMLEDVLAPAVIARAKDEVQTRVITSFISHTEKWNWELMDNNWCAVCAGSIGSAALYLFDDDNDDILLEKIIQRLMPTFDRYIESFYPDGVCPEGLSYWTYGMSYYINFADLLLKKSDRKINLLSGLSLKKIAAFQQQCYFPLGATLHFSDASEEGTFRFGLSSYLAKHIEGIKAPDVPYNNFSTAGGAKTLLDNCGRFAGALRDIVWAGENVPLTGDKPRINIFPDAQWLLCTGAGDTGFAAKGGHNGESHNHNDVGNFIFYKNGKMAIADLGAGEYTKDYFGNKRYEIFCNRSKGHNVPIIAGEEQQAGVDFCARDCVITAESSSGVMTLDIAGAYSITQLLQLIREFNFDTQAGTLRLKDSFTFGKNPLPVIERFVTYYRPVVKGDIVSIGDFCTLKNTGKREGQISLSINEVEHRNHEGEQVIVYTIDFSCIPEDKLFSIEFEIEGTTKNLG